MGRKAGRSGSLSLAFRPFFFAGSYGCAPPSITILFACPHFRSLAYNLIEMTLEETLIAVWQQVLRDRVAVLELGGEKYPVKRTPSSRLRQVDFQFAAQGLRGLQQNPKTKSRWAALARAGKRVMQFLDGGRYVGVVVDGKLTLYGKPRKSSVKVASKR